MRCAKFSHLEQWCAKFSHTISHSAKISLRCAKLAHVCLERISHLPQWCAKLDLRKFTPWKWISHLGIGFAPWNWGVRKLLPLAQGFRTLVLGCAKFSHLEIRCAKIWHLEIRCSVSLVFLPLAAFDELSPSFMIFFVNLSSKSTWIKTI